MHDTWNPWHGCVKCSEGCQHCYVYYQDRLRDQSGRTIYPTKTKWDYPIQKDRKGRYKIKSGETLRVCMTSDFFLKEADPWRPHAWDLMRQRPDVAFFLVTKRPQRVLQCLPPDWGEGWENVFFHVTCENQRRAEERLPLLLSLPFRHKGIFCAPLLGPISLAPYLASGQIDQVVCGGENYDGARPCDFDWVKALRRDCVAHNVSFCFIETGTHFVKDGRHYHLPSKRVQSQMAHKSGMSFQGKPISIRLEDEYGPLTPARSYQPHFRTQCNTCGSRMICNGCSDCGRCKDP